MKTFQVSILVAERPFYQGPCLSLRVPASDGEYGILADHRNMIAALVPGTLKFQGPDGGEAEEAREVLLQKASLQSHHAAQAQMARALNRLRVKEQQMVN